MTPWWHYAHWSPLVTPVPVARGVFVNWAHLMKSNQTSWRSWRKSVQKHAKLMANLSTSRQQWAEKADPAGGHGKEVIRNASGCVPLWLAAAGTGEEEEWGLASAKHCQASIENTISYPPPSRRPATTASTSSVQIWRKIKFWILNSDLHVHFASDVGLCILSVMSECIMTPSILLG